MRHMVDESLPWVAQLRRGATEHCILALLSHGESYGFQLVRSLSSFDGLVASQGTVYPLLTRLKRTGLVDTVWRESSEGPPRKYYFLTEAGDRSLTAFIDYWNVFRASMDSVLHERDTR